MYVGIKFDFINHQFKFEFMILVYIFFKIKIILYIVVTGRIRQAKTNGSFWILIDPPL